MTTIESIMLFFYGALAFLLVCVAFQQLALQRLRRRVLRIEKAFTAVAEEDRRERFKRIAQGKPPAVPVVDRVREIYDGADADYTGEQLAPRDEPLVRSLRQATREEDPLRALEALIGGKTASTVRS